MKVLHIVPGIGSVYGGPATSILNLVKSLALLGIEVDIVTTNANGYYQLNVPLQTWIQQDGYRIQYFPCLYMNDYKISMSMTNWLLWHIRDYDVVNTHAIFSYANLPAYWITKFFNIPNIIHPHGMLEDWALNYKNWKKLPYYNLIEKQALQVAKAIRVLAYSEVESIKHLGLKTPLAFVPNGIWQEDFIELTNSEYFYQKFPQTRDKNIILFLGRIDPKKGLDILAKAFGKIHEKFPKAHLVIAGPDNINFLPKVKKYFAEAKCLDAVTFTGMLTGSSKNAALAAADMYVAPSYSEGFSMSVLEGMAAGLPCVITTGCNFPEAAVAEAAHVVDIDSDAIANALIHCLTNPEAAKIMGDRARQLVFEKYTWENIALQMKQIYTNILEKNPISTISELSHESGAIKI
ncbi:glycosyltransferase [Tolypothrix sp. PCC 7910]|uniref:glycosyltransferase n=1 Tax=Tolypothrix sp. PCC 7910 TaxID=2099387 RepID=UPI001427704C|nr:glycosyltransferase [Tolypothrix sp. PCC 7910]QIR37999.1 glycosyltransferase [Tolypothrix sp. PCC 7910]